MSKFYRVANIDDLLSGGKGDELSIKSIPSDELEKGIDVENEHTPSDDIALDIVKDHEQEAIEMTGVPNYYEYLENMENQMKEDGKRASDLGIKSYISFNSKVEPSLKPYYPNKDNQKKEQKQQPRKIKKDTYEKSFDSFVDDAMRNDKIYNK